MAIHDAAGMNIGPVTAIRGHSRAFAELPMRYCSAPEPFAGCICGVFGHEDPGSALRGVCSSDPFISSQVWFNGSMPKALVLSALFALVGCSSTATTCPNAPATQPLPVGVSHRDGTFRTEDGLDLYYQVWGPDTGDDKAVLVLVHGLKDHSDRYAQVAWALAAHDYAVYAFDLRGHGRSEGDRVWVGSFEDYLEDLDVFLRAVVRTNEMGRPIFLFGHSMGGAIVTLYTLEYHPPIAGLILSAPAIHVDVWGITQGLTHALAFMWPTAPAMNLDDESFSRDPQVVAGMKCDPLITDGRGPAQTASELLDAMDTIHDRQAELALPILLLHGTADAITDPAGTQGLYAGVSSPDKTLKLYPGLYHDLLHEPEKAQVLADILAWLDAHSAAAVGGPDPTATEGAPAPAQATTSK
jgi:alpha-beta hydrolase superfamily lysophospholipase